MAHSLKTTDLARFDKQIFLVIDARTQTGTQYVSSIVKQLKHCAYDQYNLGSKPTRAIQLCPWERHLMALFPAWWSWQAVLNYSHISIKLQADSNILASQDAGPGHCLPYIY